MDPIRDSHNWYAYVGNDSVNYTDPWGLEANDKAAAGTSDYDDCEELQEKIKKLRDELERRDRELREDKYDLYHTKPTGTFSWKGHQQKFEETQRQLQKLLDKFDDLGCGDGSSLPDDVEDWATRPVRQLPEGEEFVDDFRDYQTEITEEDLEAMKESAKKVAPVVTVGSIILLILWALVGGT